MESSETATLFLGGVCFFWLLMCKSHGSFHACILTLHIPEIGRKLIDHALASQIPSHRTNPRAGAALKEEDCWWCGHGEHHATMCKRCDSFCNGAGSDISAIPRALALIPTTNATKW